MNLRSPDDDGAQLLQKLTMGDRNAFTELHRRFCPVVRSFLVSISGYGSPLDDLTQEVFARAWRRRKTFRGSSSCMKYLCGIARNVVFEERRKVNKERKTVHHPDLRSLQLSSNDRPALESAARKEEVSRVLARAKSKLSRKQLQAFELVHVLGISTAKAAKLAGCSRSAFRDRSYRARKHLRESLQDIL